MARSKNDETGQIVIRPPAGMRDRIKAAAEANNRSMNAEIVATLEDKYPAPQQGLINYLEVSEYIQKLTAEVQDRATPDQRKLEIHSEITEIMSRISHAAENAGIVFHAGGYDPNKT